MGQISQGMNAALEKATKPKKLYRNGKLVAEVRGDQLIRDGKPIGEIKAD
jgi:hypothetical protein